MNRASKRMHDLLDDAYNEGVIDGYGKGYKDGVEDTKEKFKPAIADGLRGGSSECGRMMNTYKDSNNSKKSKVIVRVIKNI